MKQLFVLVEIEVWLEGHQNYEVEVKTRSPRAILQGWLDLTKKRWEESHIDLQWEEGNDNRYPVSAAKPQMLC